MKKAIAFTGHRPEVLPFGKNMDSGNIDEFDLLIAVYNGKEEGGTAYTVNYALDKGKEILIINPNTMEKTWIPKRDTDLPLHT